jgi:outer membrane lipoprotein-sorting protein
MLQAAALRAVAVGSLCLPILLATSAAADPASDAALARFGKALDGVADYTATLVVHEVAGARTQDRTVFTSMRRPDRVKDVVIAGDGKGGVAVWEGGDTIRGHQGGLLRFITLTVGMHDPKATSMRGATIEDGTLTWQLNHLRSLQSKLTVAAGPAIDGQPTEALSAENVDPKTEQGMTREVYFLSRATSLPLRFEGYDGTTLVRRTDYLNLRVNVGLKESDFTL